MQEKSSVIKNIRKIYIDNLKNAKKELKKIKAQKAEGAEVNQRIAGLCAVIDFNRKMLKRLKEYEKEK